MNVKKFVLTWLAGFVAMFLLSGLWYIVIMGDYYNVQFAQVNRPEPYMAWIAIGYLVWAFLMAYIYPIGYKGRSPVKEGLIFGVLMGLITVLPLQLVLYGVYNVPLTGTLIDSIWQVVEKGLGGIVIGLVYGSSAKTVSD